MNCSHFVPSVSNWTISVRPASSASAAITFTSTIRPLYVAERENVTPTLDSSRDDVNAVSISLPSGFVVGSPAFLKYDHWVSWDVIKTSACLWSPIFL